MDHSQATRDSGLGRIAAAALAGRFKSRSSLRCKVCFALSFSSWSITFLDHYNRVAARENDVNHSSLRCLSILRGYLVRPAGMNEIIPEDQNCVLLLLVTSEVQTGVHCRCTHRRDCWY